MKKTVSMLAAMMFAIWLNVKTIVPDGKFLEPCLWIRSSQTPNAKPMIEQWLEDIDSSNLAAGIEGVSEDMDSPISVYDVGGLLVAEDETRFQSLPGGVYIVNSNGKTSKIVKK